MWGKYKKAAFEGGFLVGNAAKTICRSSYAIKRKA